MMEKFWDASTMKARSDFMAEMMMDEKHGKELTREYLKTRFLSSVGRSLYYVRRKAGLTQAQVAERMNTTQSVIARYEADKKGSITFHRYMDFAIACGMMPRSLTIHPILESINSLRDEIIDQAGLYSSQASFSELQGASVQVLIEHGCADYWCPHCQTCWLCGYCEHRIERRTER